MGRPDAIAAACDNPKRQKYNQRKKELDGHIFASGKEAKAYAQLTAIQSAGEISGLELQPRFKLQDAFRDGSGKWRRAIFYTADFAFLRGGRRVIVEVKSKATRTQAYMIRLKLFIAKYPELVFEEWV